MPSRSPDAEPAAPAAAGEDDPDKSMETILASIRRIISEEEPAAPGASPTDAVMQLDESMVVSHPAPEPGTAAAAPSGVPQPTGTASLLSPDAHDAAARAFGALRDARRPEPERDPGPNLLRTGGPTLEDLVRDELREQLKRWLDANLPALVERLVRAEIDELRRRG